MLNGTELLNCKILYQYTVENPYDIKNDTIISKKIVIFL